MLTEKSRGENTVFIQSCYNDDFRTVGYGTHPKPVITRIEVLGPGSGLFVEQDKSQFVWAPGVSEETAKVVTHPLYCSHREGVLQVVLGGVLMRPN